MRGKTYHIQQGGFGKRLALCLMALLVAALMLSGCSTRGNDYMRLNKEISTLPQYTYQGTIKLGVTLPDSLTKEFTAADKTAFAALENMTITYSGYSIATTGTYYMDMHIQSANGKAAPLRMYLHQGQVLINSADLLALLATYGGSEAETTATKTALAGTDWLDFSSDVSAAYGFTFTDKTDFAKINTFTYNFMDYLNANSFQSYQPDIFSQVTDGYKMTVSKEQLPTVLNDFVLYVVNHYPAILQDVKAYLNTVDDTVYEGLGLEKQDVAAALADFPTPTALTAQDKLALTAALKELTDLFAGSELSSTLTKSNNNTYAQSTNMVLAIASSTNTQDKLKLSINVTMNINAGATVTDTYPTSGIKSIRELAKTQKAAHMSGIWMLANGKLNYQKTYAASSLNHSDAALIKAQVVDGYNYLPLRQMAELFDEQVEWDSTLHKAFVIQGDRKIEMVGFVKNDLTYVKFRELEKLGFTIDYDAANGGTVTISK